MANRYVEGRDYTVEYRKKKGGREYAVLKMSFGDWKIEADDDFVRIYHRGTQMMGFDVNGFNSLIRLISGFTDVAEQLREERNNPPAGAPESR